MPVVTISETYDLSTTVNKMGLLAVHTPSMKLIKWLYPGLVLQYKNVRPIKCDIAVACASLLPADPLQVGTETGDIAPQDLFNPILYRAISTESFNTLFNRIYGYSDLNLDSSNASMGSLASPRNTGHSPFPSLSATNQEDLYYALLSESGWRKAMPQSGLQMRDLVPLVHYLVSTFGNGVLPTNSTGLTYENVVQQDGTTINSTANVSQLLRGGKTVPLPKIPTLQSGTFDWAQTSDSSTAPSWSIPVGATNNIPKCWCAALVFPPSKLHKLFFRMTIRWTVEFSDLCSIVERSNTLAQTLTGSYTHLQDYSITTSKEVDDVTDKMDVSESTVDGLGVDAKMIMQS